MLRLVVVLCVVMCLSARASVLSEGHLFPYDDPMYSEIHGNGVYTVAQEKDAKKKTEKLRKDFEQGRLLVIADHTNLALRAAIRVGYLNLRKRGFASDAAWLEKSWKQHDGELTRIVSRGTRDIGDFEPLSKYLAVAYELLEYKLGYQLCYTLRLTDIKTLNHGIPVVFSPCKHTLLDFTEHFCHDEKYRGLLPVVSYWVTVVTCSVATFGAGYFFICSPIGMLVELSVDKVLAPALAPKIYEWSCQ